MKLHDLLKKQLDYAQTPKQYSYATAAEVDSAYGLRVSVSGAQAIKILIIFVIGAIIFPLRRNCRMLLNHYLHV